MNDINDPEVASISPVSGNFYILWSLGNQCTYSCSYCDEHFHSGNIKYQPTEVVQRTLNLLPKTTIIFTGGEPTFHPDFEKIILEKPNRITVGLITNGSRPIAFWERIIQKLNGYIMLSYHSEFAQMDRFLATAKLIFNTHKKPGLVHVMMSPANWDSCITVYNKLLENGIQVAAKPLVEDFGMFSAASSYKGYTVEQEAFINNANTDNLANNIIVKSQDGQELYRTSSYTLLNSKQTNFSGWKCYAGAQRIYIGMDGTVGDTTCGQTVVLGNIYDTFTLVAEPKICKQDFCWSHSETRSLKTKER
jgi:MoaA/NifB/PqqE/SkfB family radical SAM enzyme